MSEEEFEEYFERIANALERIADKLESIAMSNDGDVYIKVS